MGTKAWGSRRNEAPPDEVGWSVSEMRAPLVDKIARSTSPQAATIALGTAPGGIGAARVQTSSTTQASPSIRLLAQLDHAAPVAVDRVITVMSLTA
jgi:hypothetical protein